MIHTLFIQFVNDHSNYLYFLSFLELLIHFHYLNIELCLWASISFIILELLPQK